MDLLVFLSRQLYVTSGKLLNLDGLTIEKSFEDYDKCE